MGLGQLNIHVSDVTRKTLNTSASDDYFEEFVTNGDTANIFLFIGHVCELRRYAYTAYTKGKVIESVVE